MNTTADYKQPGTGAIEFAFPFIEGYKKEEALPIIAQLMKEELHDTEDKRIKRCAYCHYHFRDTTRPNNAKTCCKPCKIANDTLSRAKKKADEEILKPNPKKQTNIQKYYARWLEYPFWIDEYEMLKNSWKHETPKGNIEQIIAAKQRDAMLGGKKKSIPVIPYNGDEKAQVTIYLKFGKLDRSDSEITTTKMKVEDMTAYYIEKYGERHIQHEKTRVEFMKARLKGYETSVR